MRPKVYARISVGAAAATPAPIVLEPPAPIVLEPPAPIVLEPPTKTECKTALSCSKCSATFGGINVSFLKQEWVSDAEMIFDYYGLIHWPRKIYLD